ncbi:MAG: hypothetical protein M3417_02445 [Actinomycetota bacterium]|nr:hypothetical protein [Actinomycetota bacterium]
MGFLLFAVWCFWHRRADHTLAALGLYLGLLDGYLKLRTGSSVVTLGRDILIVAIALGVLLRAMHSRERLQLPALGGFVLAFSAIVVVELFNPNAPSVAAGLAGVRQHLEFVPLFFLGYAVMRRESRLQKLAIILVVCASIGGIVSYIQSTLTPEQIAQWGPGYRERVLGTGVFAGSGRVAFNADGSIAVRPFGLGSDVGGGSLAAALALPALVGMMLWARGMLRVALIPLSIGLALAVATSGSRAGLIIVFVSIVAFGLLAATSGRTLRLVASLAVITVLVYAVFQQLGPGNSTAERAVSIAPNKVVTTYQTERGSSAAKVGEYVVRYPLGLGVGSVGPAGAIFGRSDESEPLDAETLWNFLVLETGLPGLSVFFLMLLTVLSLALRRIRRIADQTLRLNLAAVAAPLFGLLVASFAGPITVGVPAGPYLWFAMGVLSYWLIRARADLPPRAPVGPRPLVVHSDTAMRRPGVTRTPEVAGA